MAICPTCYQKYPSETGACPNDGTALVPEETFAHVDRDVAEGTVVGEYKIESKLGEGGFGAVYRAVHPLIGKMAAVKVLSRQFSSNPQMVSRFVAEARAVNQIRHRNIIDIFSFGQLPDGRQYYIMELLEGTTFDQYIAQKKRLPIGEALPILRAIARALDAAHAKNIVHRDLKPENVFLVFDEEGRVEPKLLDFGLVKLLKAEGGDHKTKTGTPMGTPYYMSPEQCRGLDNVDARTDVYSFGALIFEVLTGETPFTGAAAMDILVKHMTAPPPRASEKVAEIPHAVDDVLARMLAKEPSDRPTRAGEAIEQLARAANLASGSPAIASYVSQPSLEAPALTDSDRAIATTLIADSQPGSVSAQATSQQPVKPPGVGQTFLGGADVSSIDPPPRGSRSRGLIVVGIVGLAGVIAALAFVISLSSKPSVTTGAPPPSVSIPVTTAAASSVSSASAVTSATPVAKDEVDVRVDGAPEGTVVTANGVEVGKAPGPFKLKANAPAKLTFAAKGYKTKDLTITPTENVLLPITLEKAPAAAVPIRKGASSSSGTINRDLEGFDNK